MSALLQKILEEDFGLQGLMLKINDNRSTMLSVTWEADVTKVSLHRMFLHAPKSILQSLAVYLRQERKGLGADLKAFIHANIQKLGGCAKDACLAGSSKGKVYDLQKIYDALNHQYFEGRLDLKIAWFGHPHPKHHSQISFGLFYPSRGLIKVNRLLDTLSCPLYFISFVVYHEMLHHLYPPILDLKGNQKIHTDIFKKKEQLFHSYELAQAWLKNNGGIFFA